MDYVYSAKNNAFFPVILLDSYKARGWDTSDAIQVDESVFIEFSANVTGKARVAGEDGLPKWEDVDIDEGHDNEGI